MNITKNMWLAWCYTDQMWSQLPISYRLQLESKSPFAAWHITSNNSWTLSQSAGFMFVITRIRDWSRIISISCNCVELIKENKLSCSSFLSNPQAGLSSRCLSTTHPSLQPSLHPSIQPSLHPSLQPSFPPSFFTTHPPSISRTHPPSISTTNPPSFSRTLPPSLQPFLHQSL